MKKLILLTFIFGFLISYETENSKKN